MNFYTHFVLPLLAMLVFGVLWSAYSTPFRSPIPQHSDHAFHGKTISDSTAIRSLIP